jgi:TetR/AcrR family transcriptional repressor of nem operon
LARPREFDRDVVLETAMDVFWCKGFEGTSIQDLVEATGVNRGSLYGAFGDKETLFAEALDYYLATRMVEFFRGVESGPVRPALRRLLESVAATAG